MQPRPSSLSSAKGMTLLELLVAAAVGVLVLGLAFSVTVANRRVYEVDQARTALNQNLRAAVDMIGADVRQAGERMPADFSPIAVVDGSPGDTLTLRRSLHNVVLPVCGDLRAGSNEDKIDVARKNHPPNAACAFNDEDDNNRDDGIDEWRAFRCAQDGVPGCQGNAQERVRAYVYNPVSRQGEWIVYDAEDSSGFKIHKANNERWQHDYEVDDLPRVYALEERTYRLSGGMLQLVMNGDAANARNVTAGATALSVRALMQDGSWKTSLGPGDDWTDVAALEVQLTVRAAARGRTLERTLGSRFMPRNILSF